MKLPHTVLITLEQWEFEHAIHVGTWRHTVRKGSGNAKHYDPDRMEDNLRASVASAATECAVAKFKNQYWGGHYWPVDQHATYRNIADVGENIEVRRVREAGNPLPVRRNDMVAGRLMVCGWPDPDSGYQDVYLIGEIDAWEGWSRGDPAPYDRTDTRLVQQAFLGLYGAVKKAA